MDNVSMCQVINQLIDILEAKGELTETQRLFGIAWKKQGEVYKKQRLEDLQMTQKNNDETNGRLQMLEDKMEVVVDKVFNMETDVAIIKTNQENANKDITFIKELLTKKEPPKKTIWTTIYENPKLSWTFVVGCFILVGVIVLGVFHMNGVEISNWIPLSKNIGGIK